MVYAPGAPAEGADERHDHVEIYPNISIEKKSVIFYNLYNLDCPNSRAFLL